MLTFTPGLSTMKMAARFGFGSLFLLLSVGEASLAETALDRYVHKPDSSYRWELARTFDG